MIFSRKELPTMVPDWFQHNSSDRTLTLAGVVGEVIDDVQPISFQFSMGSKDVCLGQSMQCFPEG